MARFNRNYLEDVLWVVETYEKHKKEVTGLSNRAVLERYINTEGRRKISENTLYRYLTVPAKKLLKELDEKEAKQKAIVKKQLKLDL